MATGGFPDAVISLNKITVKLVVSTSHNHAASRTGVTHKAIVRRNGRLQVHCKGLEARALWEVLDKEVGDFPDFYHSLHGSVPSYIHLGAYHARIGYGIDERERAARHDISAKVGGGEYPQLMSRGRNIAIIVQGLQFGVRDAQASQGGLV
ncbi:hypothetical protein CERSUDRAFT_125159 [Gelatoporia subvermispora B]|uniref:Uncharacterized protein n=1 Tax=Ceriporiopsis subvermispora (strain B) TaxID=914234 RepID=M2R9U2_CERS8|nr:hypothetical protein CERSUDRAFT_125159 [Gelatoporia subvermispora B]